MVPSSSEDITRAMRGQPKRLSQNYLRKNGGNVMFWLRFMPEMFSALSAAFFAVGHFVGFSACLAVHYFAVYSVL